MNRFVKEFKPEPTDIAICGSMAHMSQWLPVIDELRKMGYSVSTPDLTEKTDWSKISDADVIVQKGRLLPFIIIGVIAAVVVSAYLGMSLGGPSCVESDTDNRGSSCVEYADDGYEATGDQKWDKFWSTLPITVIIASLIAVIVRNQMEKDKKK